LVYELKAHSQLIVFVPVSLKLIYFKNRWIVAPLSTWPGSSWDHPALHCLHLCWWLWRETLDWHFHGNLHLSLCWSHHWPYCSFGRNMGLQEERYKENDTKEAENCFLRKKEMSKCYKNPCLKDVASICIHILVCVTKIPPKCLEFSLSPFQCLNVFFTTILKASQF